MRTLQIVGLSGGASIQNKIHQGGRVQMPPTVLVRSADAEAKEWQENLAQRVIAAFGDGLCDVSLLCLLDDADCHEAHNWSKANRGIYARIRVNSARFLTDEFWARWPTYVKGCIFVDGERVFDHFIYLHGSTCSDGAGLGLTITLAHELQHCLQWRYARALWATNTLVPQLPKWVITALGLRWSDIPHEREARIVAKRIAENVFGPALVGQFIDRKITEAVNADDEADWLFVRSLAASTQCDLASQTGPLFQRLKPYKRELEALLREMRDNSDTRDDFRDVDLDALCSDV